MLKVRYVQARIDATTSMVSFVKVMIGEDDEALPTMEIMLDLATVEGKTILLPEEASEILTQAALTVLKLGKRSG